MRGQVCTVSFDTSAETSPAPTRRTRHDTIQERMKNEKERRKEQCDAQKGTSWLEYPTVLRAVTIFCCFSCRTLSYNVGDRPAFV